MFHRHMFPNPLIQQSIGLFTIATSIRMQQHKKPMIKDQNHLLGKEGYSGGTTGYTFHVAPRSCDCPTAFFHSKFPDRQEIFTAPMNHTYMFGQSNVVYNKSNSTGIFQLDTDGALLIQTGGTYFVDFDVYLNNLTYITGMTSIDATLIIESPAGFTPFNQQQLLIMFKPVTTDDFGFQMGLYHANAVIHVGDANYGVFSPQARVYVQMNTGGVFDYTSEMRITVRN